MLYTFTIILIAILCVVLIIVILLQSGQGAGLSGGLAGNAGGAGNMMGARRTADFLSKATSILGGIFLTLCLLANFVIDRDAVQGSAIQRGAIDQPIQERFELPAETPSAIPTEPAPDNNNDN